MDLKEYLHTIPKMQVVSIGTKSGSGYLYIGLAGDIVGISRSFANICRTAKKELLHDNQLLHSGRVQNKDYIDRVQRRIDIRSEYIRTYLPALKRNVHEVYERYSEDGVAVIIDGEEYGFWSADEFRNKDRKTNMRYRL